MIKRFQVMLLSLCAAVVAGCAFVPTSPDSNASVSFMVFGDPAEKAAYESLVQAFETKHPTIDVDIVHIPSQADYRKRLGTDFAAGTPADVVLINYRRYAAFAAKGTLEPLGSYLATSSLIKEQDFYPEAVEPFRWNGTLMCIPQNISSLVVYYNKQLFDEAGLPYPQPGWTWNEFLKTAQALTKDRDGDGTVEQFGIGTEVELIRVVPFIWQLGGDVVNSREAPTRLNLDSRQARQAIQWFVDLQVRHHVAPDAVQEEAEDSETRFQNGRLGMLLNSRRGVPTYREITAFEWDVASLPQAESAATILHADAYCLPSASTHKQDAWTFIEFANSPEGQAIVARSGRTVPSLRSVAESPAFLDPSAAPKNSKVFLDVIPDTLPLPIMEQWADLEEVAGEELRRAYYGRASVDEAIRAAITNTQIFFQKQP
jgi:multiple sugar transport system substrate-binding protein